MIADDACTVVFLGFSCSTSEAHEALANAVYLPPASCGDILYALRLKPRRLVIIDGVFGHVPSVWHKEILYALSKNVEVWGAASMGALRAAELDSFGMRGFGQVYQWFKEGTLTDDDEVALLYVEDEKGYQTIVDPMVNIRATIERAIDADVVSVGHGERVIRRLKATDYSQRSLDEYLRVASDVEDHCLRDWLSKGNFVDIKQQDAVGLLCHLREASPEAFEVTPVQLSLSLRRLLLRTATTALPFSGFPLPNSERLLQLYATKPIFPSLRRLAVLLAFFDGWLRSQGSACSLDELMHDYVEPNLGQATCAELLKNQLKSCITPLRRLAKPDVYTTLNFYEASLKLDGTYPSFKAICNLDITRHKRDHPIYHRILVVVSALWELLECYLQTSDLEPSSASLEKYTLEFRRERGLLLEHDMRNWLRENDLNLREAQALLAASSNFNYLLEGCFFEQFGFMDVAYDRNWLLYALKIVAPEETIDIR